MLISISLISQGMSHGRGFPLILALLVSFFGALILIGIFVWVGIGIAVYHDAKKRGMEPLLWALVATLVPYLLGLIAYLIIRHPIQSFCPSCSQPIHPGRCLLQVLRCSRPGSVFRLQPAHGARRTFLSPLRGTVG